MRVLLPYQPTGMLLLLFSYCVSIQYSTIEGIEYVLHIATILQAFPFLPAPCVHAYPFIRPFIHLYPFILPNPPSSTCPHTQDNHKCVEKSMHHNCPICFEFLFDSIRPTSVLRCGHTIHSECFSDMQRNGMLSCPVCLKSVSDFSHVWQSIDAEVAAAPMPEEYRG